VIRSAAKKAYTIAGLAEMVSADIADDKERAAFVRRFAGDKSTPTGDRRAPAPHRTSPCRRPRPNSIADSRQGRSRARQVHRRGRQDRREACGGEGA